MGAENEGIQVAFGANIQGLTNGLGQATSGVQQAVSNMQGHFAGLGQVLENLKAPFLALTGMMAGGAMFKGAVDATISMTAETAQLARVLGISTEEASGLREALDKLGIGSDLYGSAVFKLQMQLRASRDQIEANGVATRNLRTGEMLPIQEVMMNGINRLKEMDKGYDANALSMLMWGRSAKEMQGLMRLTEERIAAGTAEAKEMGTVVGQEQVAAMRAYKEAMVDVRDIFESIQIQVGSQLLPKLTGLAKWFSDNGQAIIGPVVKGFEALATALSYTTVQVALVTAALWGPMTAAWAKASTAVMAFAQTLRVQMALGAMEGVTGIRALVGGLSTMINPWMLAGAAIIAGGIALERWITSASRAAEEHAKLVQATQKEANEFTRLSDELERADASLRRAKAGTDEYKSAADKKAIILAQLNALYPGFNKFLVDEDGHERSIAEAIRMANTERRKKIEAQIADTEATMASLKVKETDLIITSLTARAWGQLGDVWAFIAGKRADDVSKAIKQMTEDLDKQREVLKTLVGGPEEGGKKKKGKFEDKPDTQKEDEQLRAFKDNLTKQLEAQGAFFNDATQMSLTYWRNILETEKLTAKQRQDIRGEVFKLEKDVARMDHETKLELLRAELDAFGQHSEARLQKQREVIAEELRVHKGRTKEVIAAERDLARMEREIEAERQALRVKSVNVDRDVALARIDADEAALGRRRDMGQVSAEEEIQALMSLENRRFMVRRAAIATELDDLTITDERKKELLGQQEILEIEHQNKIKQIRHQGNLDAADSMREFLQPLSSAFQSSLEGLLAGTMSWSAAMKNVWRGVGQAVDQMIVRTTMSWLAGEKTKTAATQMSVLQRVAAEAWGVMKSVALAIWAGMKWIAIKGYEAAAGAWSAISSIPYVGPFLAPAVAAGVLASVIGLGSKVASAAGGWETVPHDQMAMIHKDEQVLPASYATGLRQLIKSGGAGQGPAQEVHQHTWTVQTLDASSFEEFLMTKGQAAVVNVTREAVRNGRMG